MIAIVFWMSTLPKVTDLLLQGVPYMNMEESEKAL